MCLDALVIYIPPPAQIERLGDGTNDYDGDLVGIG